MRAKPLVLTLFSLFLILMTPSVGALDVERDALMKLYVSADGENWTYNAGWGGEGSYCTWYGVTCEAGNVTALFLGSNQLSGSIPAELGSLNSLEGLGLYENQLSGSIPVELGKLNSLITLNLNDNQLSGSIPAELGSLNNLESLELFSNQLTGSIPAELGSLNSLEWLGLGSNQLSGSIPAELGNLNSLERLDLYSNQLGGPIPAELGNLSNLVWLNLNSNPSLVCWQTQTALDWAHGLREFYGGPGIVCFVCLPVVMSAGD